MTKRSFAPLVLVISLALLNAGAQAQTGINVAGNWNITSSGETFATGTLRIAQLGSAITGTYDQSGRIDGKFQTGGLQVDANWSDSRGSGWMTIVFTADGTKFSGEWGRPGSPPAGHFEASRAAYPSVTGVYYVSVPGGSACVSGRMTLHQLGQDVVGNFGASTQLNGTVAADANNLTGTWKGSCGEGWIKLKFADDSKSFQGTWGLASSTESQGQIVGSVLSRAQLSIKGVWNVASSGEAFAASVLKFQQQGQTVIGSYKHGRLHGTLPLGSLVLTGTWRDSRGSGDLVLRFAADGKSFQGSWAARGKGVGSVIGRRALAASPALR